MINSMSKMSIKSLEILNPLIELVLAVVQSNEHLAQTIRKITQTVLLHVLHHGILTVLIKFDLGLDF